METAVGGSGVASAVVIGAGFAGLAAAEALRAAGVAVTVLERERRVGGRVWSQTLPGGAIIEMGAEFVTEGYTVLPALVERLGLELAPMGMSFTRRDPRGGIGVDAAALARGWRRWSAAVEPGAGDGLTVAAAARAGADRRGRARADRLPDPGLLRPSGIAARRRCRARRRCICSTTWRRGGWPAATSCWRSGWRRGCGCDWRRRRCGWRRSATAFGSTATSTSTRWWSSVPAPATDGIAFDPPLPAWKADALARVVVRARRQAGGAAAGTGAAQLGAVGARSTSGRGRRRTATARWRRWSRRLQGRRRLWTRCGVDAGPDATWTRVRGAAPRPATRRRSGGAGDLAGAAPTRAPARPAGGSRRSAGAARWGESPSPASTPSDTGTSPWRARCEAASGPPAAARKRLKRPAQGEIRCQTPTRRPWHSGTRP